MEAYTSTFVSNNNADLGNPEVRTVDAEVHLESHVKKSTVTATEARPSQLAKNICLVCSPHAAATLKERSENQDPVVHLVREYRI